MNSLQQNTSTKDGRRETLGVVAKLVAIIVATFVFAAFASAPAHPQSSAEGSPATASLQTPNRSH